MPALLAITMGDPCGVGPEIILKALARKLPARVVVYGDARWLRLTAARLRKPWPFKMFVPPSLSRLATRSKGPVLVDFGTLPEKLVFGKTAAWAGRASGFYIEAAVKAALRGDVSGIVTAPINKISFERGGWGRHHRGHTEMIAALCGARHASLMLVHGRLRAIHVTSHVALAKVPGLITASRVLDTLATAHDGLRRMGVMSPRLAVCGLNPHAGDGGLMGTEEAKVILPAVRRARLRGIRAEGPFAADAVWPGVLAGRFDAGIAMYHDQGQIAVKLLAMDSAQGLVRGVNVTLGLPIIRTSVAHGTAFDLAGTGRASDESLVDAIHLAARMARRSRG